MPKYKLTYFHAIGRGEVSRMLFELAGVEYEDNRLFADMTWPSPEARAKWMATKHELGLPFEQVPVLVRDGEKLCQSHAIARYLALEFGYAGKDNWEKARADMIAGCVYETVEKGRAAFTEKDPTKKAELKQKFLTEMEGVMNRFNTFLEDNKGGDGYFVGDGLTWADLEFAVRCDQVFSRMGESVETFWKVKWPKLLALKKRVESEPKIAAWIAKRPKTQW